MKWEMDDYRDWAWHVFEGWARLEGWLRKLVGK